MENLTEKMENLIGQIMIEIHKLYGRNKNVRPTKYDVLFLISGIAEEYGIDVDDLI